jgi:hypothetical protein
MRLPLGSRSFVELLAPEGLPADPAGDIAEELPDEVGQLA